MLPVMRQQQYVTHLSSPVPMSTFSLQDGMRAQFVAQPLLQPLLQYGNGALHLPQESYLPSCEAAVHAENEGIEEKHRAAESRILALQAECDKLEKVGSSFICDHFRSLRFTILPFRPHTYRPHIYRPHTYSPLLHSG